MKYNGKHGQHRLFSRNSKTREQIMFLSLLQNLFFPAKQEDNSSIVTWVVTMDSAKDTLFARMQTRSESSITQSIRSDRKEIDISL